MNSELVEVARQVLIAFCRARLRELAMEDEHKLDAGTAFVSSLTESVLLQYREIGLRLIGRELANALANQPAQNLAVREVFIQPLMRSAKG